MLQLGRMDAVQAEAQSFELTALLDLEEIEAQLPESDSNDMCLKLLAFTNSGPKLKLENTSKEYVSLSDKIPPK